MPNTVLLVGGTSHCGKSSLARRLQNEFLSVTSDTADTAARDIEQAFPQRWDTLSTDQLARHPGRPWSAQAAKLEKAEPPNKPDTATSPSTAATPTNPLNAIPQDVVNYYHQPTKKQIEDVWQHYTHNLGPIIESVVASRLANPYDRPLILEGSALLPDIVAQCSNNYTDVRIVTLWLTASEQTLRARISQESDYHSRTKPEKYLIDAFVERSLAFDERLRAGLGPAANLLGVNDEKDRTRLVKDLLDRLLGMYASNS